MTPPDLPAHAVRTRFAPSPTGDLHVGNLRVAAFNFLFSRKHEGSFIIRIEDTDVERNLEGSVDRLLGDLRWLGVEWDEGPDVGGPFGPYLQSARAEGQVARAHALQATGLAYLCFCTETELRAPAEVRGPPGCPGGCRGLDLDEARTRANADPAALRFGIPDTEIEVVDHTRGVITFSGRDIDDFVILRADGRPTYNFAVVVDDIDMQITHVIRGSGHLSNTPKQALLFDALGAKRPVFVHLPTVLGADGSKLSKRTGAPGVDRLREEGFHPHAVINYLSLLGWSPSDDREVLSLEELAAELDLDRLRPSNTVFDPEKMRWMSGQHIARMPSKELVSALEAYIDRDRFPASGRELELGVEAIRTRLQTYGDVNDALSLLYPSAAALQSAHEALTKIAGAREVLAAVRDRLASMESWNAEVGSEAVRDVGRQLGVKGAQLFHPVRLALCGAASGPDLGMVMAALGRVSVLERLADAAAGLRD